ncbi:MAG: acyl-CoA/acyl-ACP dehydrogenase [Candidatus Solibacter usitatus]|nr:acyl-CoA/acyl-ACP dehydrogenase [Candidatus Solibacter usitatus]
MRFELSETQQLLQKTARQFLTNECPMAEVRKRMETDNPHDAALHKKMAEQGWTGMIFPEEYGGMALGMVELAATFEQMGRVLLPGAFFSTVALAGSILDAAGNPEQKAKWLTPICEGTALATAALIEESPEWETATWSATAKASGSGYVLDGKKMFVTDAATADFIVAAVKLSGELALVVVPANAPGLSVRALRSYDLTRRVSEVSFQGVNVGADHLLAKGAAAEAALHHGLNVAVLALTAEMAGGMARALEITTEYAKTRKQFDTVIGKFQAVQHLCADMYLWTESSRAAVYYAAYALDKRLPEADAAISVAKVYAGDSYREVGNRGIQVHGGMGFTWENDMHLFYRRAKASESALGETAYHRERLARLVIDAV